MLLMVAVPPVLAYCVSPDDPKLIATAPSD